MDLLHAIDAGQLADSRDRRSGLEQGHNLGALGNEVDQLRHLVGALEHRQHQYLRPEREQQLDLIRCAGVPGVDASEEARARQYLADRDETLDGVVGDPCPAPGLALALAASLEIDADPVDPGRVRAGREARIVGPERQSERPIGLRTDREPRASRVGGASRPDRRSHTPGRRNLRTSPVRRTAPGCRARPLAGSRPASVASG